jgi:hypothetical protein
MKKVFGVLIGVALTQDMSWSAVTDAAAGTKSVAATSEFSSFLPLCLVLGAAGIAEWLRRRLKSRAD